MEATGIKFDDGSGGFTSNCFPVRGLLKQFEDGGGAWITAHRAEQRRRFKAVLCSKPRTFDRIREERKRAEKEGTNIIPPVTFEEEGEDDSTILDGFYLMKHCCVEDPADLCSITISGKGLSEVKEEDFTLFDNVAYVNASENFLPFNCFKLFPILRELEVSLNGLRGLKVTPGDFPALEMLDLSYNNLSPEDLLPLGLIPNLRILHVTGNSLKNLPADMARPHVIDESTKIQRYPMLEILMADDNKLSDLSTFAALAGLRRLKHLNLAKNEIYSVPQLTLIEGRHVTQDIDFLNKKLKKRSGRKSRNTPGRKSRGTPRCKSSPQIDHGDQEEEPNHINYVINEDQEGQAEAVLGAAKNEHNHSSLPTAPPGATGGVEGEDAKAADTRPSKVEEEEDVFGELNLEELDAKVEETLSQHHMDKIKEMDETEESPPHTIRQQQDDDKLPPPFPELRYLNLAHNRLSEEEGLLAVAAWPLLGELIIHDNPLTTEHSGDPPILRRFLCDRLGIHLQRKPPGALKKPAIEVPQKEERKVKTRVPPIPRCNVEQLLALEAPKAQPLESTPTPGPTPRRTLPPIPATPESEAEEEEQRHYDGDAFFMTQVDEQNAPRRKTPSPLVPHRPAEKRSHRRPVPKQYKGYEELLEGAEDSKADEEIPMPKDIQGNIRALQYTLNHPLVFRENQVDLENRQKIFQPYEKGTMAAAPVRETKKEKVDRLLEKVKKAKPVIEVPLEKLLHDRKKNKAEFQEAKILLGEVQRKYNRVRVSSMKHARSSAGSSRQLNEAKNILGETIQGIKPEVPPTQT